MEKPMLKLLELVHFWHDTEKSFVDMLPSEIGENYFKTAV